MFIVEWLQFDWHNNPPVVSLQHDAEEMVEGDTNLHFSLF